MPLPYSITIPPGEQSSADENSFRKPHPCDFVLIFLSFLKSRKTQVYTYTHMHAEPVGLPVNQRRKTSNLPSLANSASELVPALFKEMFCCVELYTNFI